MNDTHGHLAGSRLLAEVGGLIRREIGSANEAFRYDGDEFCLLLPGFHKAAARKLTRTLRQRLRDHVLLTAESLSLRVTGSFGLATFPEDGDSVHTMLSSADSMMYEVKNTTRDDIAVMGELRGAVWGTASRC